MTEKEHTYSKIDNYETRSEEVQEILGHIPAWIIRSGISVIFVVVILLMTGSYFFKYPDVIKASMEIITQNPPAVIIAKRSGKLAEILAEDKIQVKQGDILGIIENSTTFKEIKDLEIRLKYLQDTLSNNTPDSFHPVSLVNKIRDLGELQNDYALFGKAYDAFLDFQINNLYEQRIGSVRNKIKVKKELYLTTKEQSKIMKDIFTISKQKHQRDSLSLQQDYVSYQQLENARMEMLSRKSSWKNMDISLASLQVEITELKNSIVSLQNELRLKKMNLFNDLSDNINNLLSKIGIWKQNYVLTSPIDGTVAFTSFWSENQNVKSGEIVFTVLPDERERIIGKIKLPMNGSGRVREGNKVQVKLTDYPSARYGMIKTIVKSISLIPQDNFYLAEVEFPIGLISNYGKEIVFKQQMQGIAEIITEDKRLLERIIEPMVDMLKN